jgi:hypothetical protein
VHGRRVRLLSLDDRYEPERTLANAQQLIWRDKVFALFGFRHAYGAGGAAGHPRSRYSAVARCQGLRPAGTASTA